MPVSIDKRWEVCSQACSRKRYAMRYNVKRETVPCLVCGKAIAQDTEKAGREIRLCSAGCREVRQREQSRQYAARHIQPKKPKKCLSCNKEFLPKPKARHHIFCSDTCRQRLRKGYKGVRVRRERPGPHSKVGFKNCARCGSLFCSYKSLAKFCSVECRQVPYQPVPRVPCLICGVVLARKVGETCGGADCIKKLKAGHRAKQKAKRRAKEKAQRTYPLVMPRHIFARDGWACQICGIDTPEYLAGTNSPFAPTLDHIEPIAARGLHSSGNTHCVCRICNSRKSDKRLDEFIATMPLEVLLPEAFAMAIEARA